MGFTRQNHLDNFDIVIFMESSLGITYCTEVKH